MNFNLRMIPQFRSGRVAARADGSILTVNGVALDFSPMLPGDVLPLGAIDLDLIVGDVTCSADCEVIVPLVYPCGPGDVEFMAELIDGCVVSYSDPVPVKEEADHD